MEMTIIFSHAKSYNPLLYWFRSVFLRHQATHVAFGIQRDKQPCVFHMSGKGAVRTPRQKFEKKNLILKEYRILPDLSEELTNHLKYLGHPYDVPSAILHFWLLILRPIRQLVIYYQIRNLFYCANFARQLDSHDKIQSWKQIDKHWASVGELQEACANSSEFVDITQTGPI